MSELDIKYRKVSMNDAELLFQWRNDPTTRDASFNYSTITMEQHLIWLQKFIVRTDDIMEIAEINGKPIGVVRADNEMDFYCLSWTVSPVFRGKGFGKEMVKNFVKKLNKPLKAAAKKENIASIKIMKHIGMTFDYEKDSFYYFFKD